MTWKQKFDKEFPYKIAPVIDDFGDETKSEIQDFIEKEIIEKLIADIPESLEARGTAKTVWFKTDDLKQQLKERWLK